jgi:hypothetical protein
VTTALDRESTPVFHKDLYDLRHLLCGCRLDPTGIYSLLLLLIPDGEAGIIIVVMNSVPELRSKLVALLESLDRRSIVWSGGHTVCSQLALLLGAKLAPMLWPRTLTERPFKANNREYSEGIVTVLLYIDCLWMS